MKHFPYRRHTNISDRRTKFGCHVVLAAGFCACLIIICCNKDTTLSTECIVVCSFKALWLSGLNKIVQLLDEDLRVTFAATDNLFIQHVRAMV